MMVMAVDGPDVPAPGVAPFLAQFEVERPSLPGAGVARLDSLRDRGMAAFSAAGFPSRRVEAWKYTDLRALAKLEFVSSSAEATGSPIVDEALAGLGDAPHRLVFLNGRYRDDLSAVGGLPTGVRLMSLAAAIEAGVPEVVERLGTLAAPMTDRPFPSLNAALMRDGAVLVVEPDVVVAEPIQIVYVTDSAAGPIAIHLRSLVVAGAHSRATLVETYAGRDGDHYFTNATTEVIVGSGARLDHYRMQQEGDAAFHLSSLAAVLADHATYDNFTLTLRGALTRNEGHVVLDGPEGDLRISGAYLGAGAQHVDNTTVIEHVKPHCRSREVFKGVLDDAARGVFQGRIHVHRAAQKTDGYQLSNGLLLSKHAEVDAKPELEIFADDVKCSHGATAGEIDHNALFYLRSRGIDEREARALLIEAFVNEALEEIEVEAVRERFTQAVKIWLADHGQAIGGQ